MTDQQIAILNDAFIAVYRSFGQYLHEATPVFDIGEEEARAVIDRQAEDARRLGELVNELVGTVHPGNFPIEWGDFHFLNLSRLLPDWIDEQKHLVDLVAKCSQLFGDAPEYPASLLQEIVGHERANLVTLQQIHSRATA